MNVKSFLFAATCVALWGGNALAQYAPMPGAFQPMTIGGPQPQAAHSLTYGAPQPSGAIRSATFGSPDGLGVIPVSNLGDTAPRTSGCTEPGCADAGCADGSCGISCTSPVGCSSCGNIGCGGKCNGPEQCCPDPCRSCGPCGWAHKVSVYGEFLYLRARDAEIPYAVVQNSNVPLNQVAPIQFSPHGIVDPDFEPAYRVGFGVSLGTCSSVGVQYTMFESTTNDAIALTGTGVGVVSLVQHPGAQNTASSVTDASAFYNLSFDMIDADFRGLLSYGPSHRVNYLLGASYGNLEQEFGATNVNNGTETVYTEIDFDGAGIRLGLEGERFSRNRRMLTYCKAISTILAGEFNSVYYQGNNFDNSIVNTGWEAGRVVPVLELEAGFGFQCCEGAYRMTAGYNFNAWFNTVKTDDWIRAVQQNNLTNLGNTMTFDGLVARLEARF